MPEPRQPEGWLFSNSGSGLILSPADLAHQRPNSTRPANSESTMDGKPLPRHPTPAAIALGLGLRAARTQRQVGVRALAAALDIEPATVSTVEHASRRPKVEFVVRVLGYLGVTGAEYRRLVELARHLADPNWLEPGPGYPDIRLDCEQAAATITIWAPTTVPDALQTPGYARAVLDAGMLTPDEVDEGALLRLTRPDTASRYTVLLGEPALHHRFCGAAVLHEQLRHLVGLIDDNRVAVQVAPTTDDWHPTLVAPFAVYEFEKRRPLVILGHHYADAYLTEQAPVTRYRDSAHHLATKRALSEGDSRDLIIEALKS
ncbi:helix-turn-helix domain-containing protein [Amycolatopsis sp. NPDC059021]|uniref:helix-turn-helix domain-containing protein n=1 Tax=Amycolatopsis sp. NPDC059021 TaxID=3346704 RepID=UPI003670F2F4